MYYLEVLQGSKTTIEQFAKDLLLVSESMPVRGNFKGHIIHLDDNDTIESIVNKYKKSVGKI